MAKDTRAEIKVDPEVELKNYSGPFKPDLRYSDFSREQLAKMYLGLQEHCVKVVIAFTYHIAEKFGPEAMAEANRDVWLNRMGEFWYQIHTEGLGTEGNDIESLMKAFQIMADWNPMNFDITFDMPSKDRANVTIHRCIGVDLAETLKQPELLQEFCSFDHDIVVNYTKFFSPDIVTTCLALPPRKSKDDICCKWEFTYESK